MAAAAVTVAAAVIAEVTANTVNVLAGGFERLKRPFVLATSCTLLLLLTFSAALLTAMSSTQGAHFYISHILNHL